MKKIPNSNGRIPVTTGSPRISAGNTKTVLQLIDAVKTEFDDTFSNGVYASSGMGRRMDSVTATILQIAVYLFRWGIN